MRSVKQIYTLGFLEEQIDELLKMILHGDAIGNLYLVMLGKRKEEPIVIYPAWMSVAHLIEEDVLVGFADGKENAFRLVESIISDIYEETYDVNVIEYFQNK
ncbi:hypothetical protein [Eubacterium oxidoreducens]|uniref:Uncharacterized protein n=1 Tax=Eubacterium oxidoreducens TaxID=1732 RepID=A0A1G6AMM3_EUBOX|nr:hypothetical protein [Eubacterium oxidoreducens]SDB09648.1 hypothetical protein SAMN02910417_00733 [Eubacterium oxidoreducens]